MSETRYSTKILPTKTSTFAIKEVIGSKLDKLEQLGVLEKVDHARWTAPIVPIHKDNGLF